MKFDEAFLAELQAKADIVDVVSRRTKLQRKGDRLWGLCPFHNEKTPSFTVSPDKQLYYCFGCGKGGSLIQFVMDSENLPFQDAVKYLADMYNMEVPDEQGTSVAQFRKRCLDMNRAAAKFYVGCLGEAVGAKARAYIEKRALTPQTVRRFGIGCAPDGWDYLRRHLQSLGYQENEAIEAGLLKRGQNGGAYDTFRDRLMFPILDASGANVIGFGGRVLEGDGNGQKYLNTGNTPVFFKKNNLYAFNIAKKSKMGRIILVEGYMDTVSLHQAGVDCAVASLGTSLTEEQARLIAKSGFHEVVITYDTDRAGTIATERAVKVLAEENLRIKILRVPGGKDPDEFVREHGAEAFLRALDKSEEQMDYRLRTLKAEVNPQDDAGKIEYAKRAAALLSELPGAIEREVYAGRVAEDVGVGRELITAEAERVRKSRYKAEQTRRHAEDVSPDRLIQPPREAGVRFQDPYAAKAEALLISLLTERPELWEQSESRGFKEENFSSKELWGIYSALRAKAESGAAPQAAVLGAELDQAQMSILGRISAMSYPHTDPERELSDLAAAIGGRAKPDVDPLIALRDAKKQNSTNN